MEDVGFIIDPDAEVFRELAAALRETTTQRGDLKVVIVSFQLKLGAIVDIPSGLHGIDNCRSDRGEAGAGDALEVRAISR